MKSQLLSLLALAFICFSCGSSSSSKSSTTVQDPHSKAHQQMHNDLYKEEVQKELAKLASTIAGVYKGHLPCADCKDIPYEIELFEDLTYTSKMTYKGASDQPFESGGTYAINPNWTLELKDTSEKMTYLKKSGDDLILLDKSGNEIRTDVPEKYILKRVNEPQE